MKDSTVLIVDDDQIIRDQLDDELKRRYFRTFLASNGQQALDILGDEEIDIILLDLNLPDVDGEYILARVKEDHPGCQIIIITGYGSAEIAVQALRSGAIDYIEKPVDMNILHAALGRAQEKVQEKTGYENKVLVVDDDSMLVERLGNYLKKQNYKVFTASNGEDGLEIIKTNQIDVLITDINLGDISGIELFKETKKISPNIEGIMVTGYSEQELAIKALRAGAFDYISKPISLDELVISINKALENIKLSKSSVYRNRELEITSEIFLKLNEELSQKINDRTSELSQAQAQLFQTSKLAILGEMSTGLAHEINQPLGCISLIIKNMQRLMERGELTDEKMTDFIQDIDASIKRMSKVIQHIRTFARQEELEFTEVSVNDTIESALALLSEQLRLHDIELKTTFGSDLPLIAAEPYQLEEVWINLLSNSKQALGEKNENTKYQKTLEVSSRYNAETDMVEIVFKDNGIGMPEDVKEKIFVPFFTTKQVGEGTGLGMSISYGIIENHDGEMQVESTEGEGTTTTIMLPTINKYAGITNG